MYVYIYIYIYIYHRQYINTYIKYRELYLLHVCMHIHPMRVRRSTRARARPWSCRVPRRAGLPAADGREVRRVLRRREVEPLPRVPHAGGRGTSVTLPRLLRLHA